MDEAEYREKLNVLEERRADVYRERRRLQEAFAADHPPVLPPPRYRTDAQAVMLVDALARAGVPVQKRSHDRLRDRAGVAGLATELRLAGATGPLIDRLRRAAATLAERPALGVAPSLEARFDLGLVALARRTVEGGPEQSGRQVLLSDMVSAARMGGRRIAGPRTSGENRRSGNGPKNRPGPCPYTPELLGSSPHFDLFRRRYPLPTR